MSTQSTFMYIKHKNGTELFEMCSYTAGSQPLISKEERGEYRIIVSVVVDKNTVTKREALSIFPAVLDLKRVFEAKKTLPQDHEPFIKLSFGGKAMSISVEKFEEVNFMEITKALISASNSIAKAPENYFMMNAQARAHQAAALAI